MIALVSTVNFALRTPAEQDGLVAGFARYLHALGGPVQILIRALPVDLHTHLHQLRTQPSIFRIPALAAAAHDHLTHLARLAHQDGDNQLLTRHVLLVLREPHRPATTATAPDRRPPERSEPERPRAGHHAPASTDCSRRLHDATTLLAAIDVSVTVLDAAHTTAVLIATCNPDHLNTRGAGRRPCRAAEAPATSATTTTTTRPADHRSRSRPDPQRPGRGTTGTTGTGGTTRPAAIRTTTRTATPSATTQSTTSATTPTTPLATHFDEFDDDFDDEFDDEVGRGVRDFRAEPAGLDEAGSGVTSWTPRGRPGGGSWTGGAVAAMTGRLTRRGRRRGRARRADDRDHAPVGWSRRSRRTR